ncbi:MAG: hypothetical protein H7177_07215 [Rhizobacter sp.]|nr:hypothetical protein [Bacteriovorax sp.]
MTNLLAKIFTFISRRDNKETWSHLEARRSTNLENLEYLKKLRIKNF